MPKSKICHNLFQIVLEIRTSIFQKSENKKRNKLFQNKNLTFTQNTDVNLRQIKLKTQLNIDFYINLSFPVYFIFDKDFQSKMNLVFNLIFFLNKTHRLLTKN